MFKQGIQNTKIIVKSSAFNIILWNANIAKTDRYVLADYSFWHSQSITFTSYDKNKNLQLLLNGNSDFENLKKASEGWQILTQKKQLFIL